MNRWRIPLEELCKSLFTLEELVRVLRELPDAAGLDAELPDPENASLNAWVFQAVSVLDRRGLVDDTLFALLEAKRPGRAGDVAEVRALWADRTAKGAAEGILLLAAVPMGLGWDLGLECRVIQTLAVDRCPVVLWPHVLVSELRPLLERHRPRILHLVAHSEDSKVLLYRTERELGALPVADMVAILSDLRHDLRLVVINGCTSDALLDALAGSVRFAVGWKGTVSAPASIAFAAAFYALILGHQPVAEAHRLAMRACGLEDKGGPHPVLMASDHADPEVETVT